MASSFPKLPGYYPTQSLELNPNYKRVSWGKQEQAANNKNEPIPEYILPRVGESWSPDQTRSLNENYMSTSHLSYRPTSFLPEITEHFSPSWVKMDKHVLRFYGYFRESVVESSIETHRVRKLVIYYYLVDGTLNIAEPKNTNTGIVQGAFLKRQRVLKADGSGKFLNPNDFRIGQEVSIYGKNILINNCDPYTREFYEKQGGPQGPAFDTPQDNFEIMSNTKHIPQKDQTMRDFMEAKLGGGKVASQKQFLTHDRKVLKFFVYSEIPYIMHYYLADDTLEIREVNFNNSGRDPFPLLLKRQKLPKRFNLNQPGQSNEEEYIRPHDIVNGEVIEIFGRKFRVEGCDLFTQNYYKEKYDVDFPLGKVERARPQEYKAPLLPPYNGFGTEEDSLSYVNRIIPKVPQKDYFKWMDNQSYLRFYVRFNTRQPEDVQRRFIVTLFLHDDTLLVYEPEQRNSGITGGKFLEKGRYKNVDNGGAYIGVTDLLVGKDVKINGFSFNVIDCDEFTRKWLFEKLGISETGKVLALANTGPLNGTRSHAMLRQSV